MIRPAFNNSASLNRRPTSCKLVTGIVLPLAGIAMGMASAGLPEKLMPTVFCELNTSHSNTMDDPQNGNRGGKF